MKDNIKYSVIIAPTKDLQVTFGWLLDELLVETDKCSKYLIFCRSRKAVRDLYRFFDVGLGQSQYVPNAEGFQDDRNRIFEMYHSRTDSDVKSSVQESFSGKDGTVRVLIATVAFGMGLNVNELYTVIHYGPSDDLDDYVQESGRVGRDGKLSHAILLKYKQCLTGSRISQGMKEYAINSTECRRVKLFSVFPFDVKSHSLAHLCCDVCEKNCNCDYCLQDPQQFWSNAEVKIKAAFVKRTERVREIQQRYVSQTERESIQKALMEFRQGIVKGQNPQSVKLYVGEDITCGISNAVIQHTVLPRIQHALLYTAAPMSRRGCVLSTGT